MKKLTQKQKDNYVKTGGVKCPACGTYDIVGEGIVDDGGAVWNEIKCSDCGKTWREIYQLIMIEEIE